MRILILGRDGQVGAALTAALAPLGEIVALGRSDADFSLPTQLDQVVHRERPAVIVNAAAYTAVDKAESEQDIARLVNTEAPARLAAAAREVEALMVHYSTDYVFDGTSPAAYGEDDQTGPLSVYGTTKRDGEVAIAQSGAEHLIFRTSWVHAPFHANFIARILALAEERNTLQVIDDQVGAPTSARLIAEVTMQAIARRTSDRPIVNGIYHLSAGGETNWYGYARFVIGAALQRGALLKATPDAIIPVPSTAFTTAARRPHNSRLSTHKLRTTLGRNLPRWEDDVLATIEALYPGATP